MKKRAYMQGKKMPPFRKSKRKLPFDHAFRHTLRKQIASGLISAIDHEIMHGTSNSGWTFNA